MEIFKGQNLREFFDQFKTDEDCEAKGVLWKINTLGCSVFISLSFQEE